MTLADQRAPDMICPRCAIAALKGVHRSMKAPAADASASSFLDALDGRDLRAVMHDGERQAGIDAPAVYQHRAGPARTLVAPFFGSRSERASPSAISRTHKRGSTTS